MRGFAPFLLAASLALPLTAHSQIAPNLGTVKFLGDSASNGAISGAAVGPYKGTVANFGDNPLLLTDDAVGTFSNIWCVDWNHYAPSTGVADSYWGTALTSNSAGHRGNGDFSKTRALAQTKYQQAAWLIEGYYDQFNANFTAKNVQGTIWYLFQPATAPASSAGYTNLIGYVPNTVSLTRDWYVLSDDESNNSCTRFSGSCNSNQEFMTWRSQVSIVPEPTTLALMGSGLLTLGWVARRRHRARRDR